MRAETRKARRAGSTPTDANARATLAACLLALSLSLFLVGEATSAVRYSPDCYSFCWVVRLAPVRMPKSLSVSKRSVTDSDLPRPELPRCKENYVAIP